MQVKRRKKFRGWAIIVSRNGSNWGLQHDRKEWPIVTKLVKTRKELDTAPPYLAEYMTLVESCMPRDVRKIYR